jgi:pyruvate dehydrogenase E2 component (dihydrolipoamide acetyltransferase)
MPSSNPPSSAPAEELTRPSIDFSVFGQIETKPLSKTQRIVAAVMTRNWVTIPHVTHHDEADISQLEEARQRFVAVHGAKVTILAFLVRAMVDALKAHPKFNASLDESGRNLIFKKYFNIGIAVDTSAGLVVPVIRSADSKGLAEIAAEIVEISELARAKRLPIDRMSGGCFTISSLGSLGGTAFTPIINAPEVAILGVCKSFEKPLKESGKLAWRTILPLSLSYDHRVINGADVGRFLIHVARLLANPEELIRS